MNPHEEEHTYQDTIGGTWYEQYTRRRVLEIEAQVGSCGHPNPVRKGFRPSRICSECIRKRRSAFSKKRSRSELRILWAAIEEAGVSIPCSLCGASLSLRTRNLDHIVPIAEGGSNDDDNLRLTCGSCNWSKGASHE